jgi:CHASE2 domain-containing sensor protein
MTPPTILRPLRALLLSVGAFSDRFGARLYVGFALVLAVFAVFAIYAGLTTGIQNKAYDLIIKSRLRLPAADPNIVILDIDEPTLAAMAGEFGRWPWPRHIMGEMVDGIAQQKPAAIVFDITFADPDIYNKESDRYLRDVAARQTNVYFPIIRLGSSGDSQSELRLEQIPGTSRLIPEASAEARLAAVVPYFFDAIGGPRLGTNNLLTDEDGILRRYPVYTDEYGWRLNSLPAAVATGLGVALPERDTLLINWRGRPPAYQHLSFHEVYFDMQRRTRQRSADEFAGKIVVIGSTAPALFDFKATSVARTHPGVEVLATAIDNLKKGDSLTTLSPLLSIVITLAALALLAAAFVYNVDTRLVNLVFTALQTGFLAVSYLVLNFSTVFVDLTVPFAFSLGYFTVARVYGTMISYRRSGHPLFSTALDPGNTCRVFMVQVDVLARRPSARLRLIGDIKKQFADSRLGVATPPLYKGIPLLAAFERDRRLFYWLVPESQTGEALTDVLAALERTLKVIERAARRYARRESRLASFRLHSDTFVIGKDEQWRDQGGMALGSLFALSANRKPDDERAVYFQASPSFRNLCREQGPPLSGALREAGLDCGERRRRPRPKGS